MGKQLDYFIREHWEINRFDRVVFGEEQPTSLPESICHLPELQELHCGTIPDPFVTRNEATTFEWDADEYLR